MKVLTDSEIADLKADLEQTREAIQKALLDIVEARLTGRAPVGALLAGAVESMLFSANSAAAQKIYS